MRIIIRARRIIDGTGKAPFAGTVGVEGDRISSIDEEEKKIVAGVEAIDVGDNTVLPGLIDAHSHLAFPPLTPEAQVWFRRHPQVRGEMYDLYEFVDSNHQLGILAAVNIQADLEAGVTTIKDLSEPDWLGLAVKQAVNMGILSGPRIFFGGIGIRVTHGHGYMSQPFDGSEAIAAAVRRNLTAGADCIKIFVTGSASDIHSELTHNYMNRQEIAAAVNEAHRAGRMVSAHAHGGQGLIDCLELGVDAIEHGMAMTEEDGDRMAGTDSYLVTTLVSYPYQLEAEVHPVIAAKRTKRAEQFPFPPIVQRAAAKGIKIAVGTDGHHGLVADGVAKLVEFGLPPMDAIVAATKTNAGACGAQHEIGTLEVGKLADIVVVKGDPLKDIKALKEVRLVMKNGKIVKRVQSN